MSTPPYIDLQSPDWAIRAALAIAQDLCERHGLQDEMLRLERDVRHQMVVEHAHRIRQAWKREIKPEVERAVDRVVDNLPDMVRQRLDQADAFSRAVYRMRPECWHVAMIDAAGPGHHQPPPEPAPKA